VVERLRDLYPSETELDHKSPFQLLIATILSAQTTDRSVNQVTPILFARYPTALRDLNGQDLASGSVDIAAVRRPLVDRVHESG